MDCTTLKLVYERQLQVIAHHACQVPPTMRSAAQQIVHCCMLPASVNEHDSVLHCDRVMQKVACPHIGAGSNAAEEQG